MRCRAPVRSLLLTVLLCSAKAVAIQVPRANYADDEALLSEAALTAKPVSGTERSTRTYELPDAPHVELVTRYKPLPPRPVADRFRSLPEETENDYSSSAATFKVNGVDVAVLQKAFLRYAPTGLDAEMAFTLPSQDSPKPERYHWRGLLAQSLLFNAIESSVRIASDSQIRTLLFHKPFWHDYVAAMGQYNMRRWSDGDSFVVNDVGHPMQGAVSGYIEIQNDPQGRELRLGMNHEYWKSRFKAFLWATVYSTHSEISPLGEAGIGNQGGWTYPINCSNPCTNPEPRVVKYTNNTGWTDFIITPTVGVLWILAEDWLDLHVSDRVAGGNESRWANKIIRGTLNPSRTAANFMRGKLPWYRDFQHPAELRRRGSGIHMLRSDEEIAEAQKFRKYELAVHFRANPLGSAGSSCVVCLGGAGGGIEFNYGLNRWLRASAALDKQQGITQKGSPAGGSTLSAGFGLRVEHNTLRHTLSLAVRPGVVLEQITLPANTSLGQNSYTQQHDSVVHTAMTTMLSSDYKVTPTFAFRSSIGNTIVRYPSPVKDPPGIGKPPNLSWLSHDNFVNRSTWICEAGPVFRF